MLSYNTQPWGDKGSPGYFVEGPEQTRPRGGGENGDEQKNRRIHMKRMLLAS